MLYEWENCPNKDVVLLHCDIPFGRSFDVGRGKTPRLDHMYDDVTPTQHACLTEMGKIEGLVSISSYAYELQIEKGRVFKWDVLKPAIISVLEKHFDGRSHDERMPRGIHLRDVPTQ